MHESVCLYVGRIYESVCMYTEYICMDVYMCVCNKVAHLRLHSNLAANNVNYRLNQKLIFKEQC